MDISGRGLAFIEGFEGYSYNAYWDSYGHVWTVGYGETEGVGPGSTMTREQATADLERRVVREYEPAIHALRVPLNQNQFDALCSFVWNLGTGSMQWDVGRYVRTREYLAAANAMLHYTYAGGVWLPGLARRRREERALFLSPPPPPPDPHHYERYPARPFPFRARTGHIFYLSERGVVQWYDHAYAQKRRDRHAIEQSRVHIKLLRDRVKRVARRDHPPAWADSRMLGWRWQKLNDRLHGPVNL